MPTAKTTLNPAYGQLKNCLHDGLRLDDSICFRPKADISVRWDAGAMKPRATRILSALVFGTAGTAVYWSVGLQVLGFFMIGDCMDVAVCEQSKRDIFRTGFIIEVALYLTLMALTAFIMWRRRR